MGKCSSINHSCVGSFVLGRDLDGGIAPRVQCKACDRGCTERTPVWCDGRKKMAVWGILISFQFQPLTGF